MTRLGGGGRVQQIIGLLLSSDLLQMFTKAVFISFFARRVIKMTTEKYELTHRCLNAPRVLCVWSAFMC